ncbi:hypothetical protein [Synechocystis sp. PCC 7509]|uniref:hypothetical protein n=1 Tax=Synechocystis sp. PCC 7509 TaxID=927677 RepID=UPI0002ACD783|nr:hypothetical protein [Synechocystis sp. PCC 7509]
MMEAFRDEIVEAEKGRTDLLKWKLILVAALGAIGLGISNLSSTAKPILSLHLTLCLIPLVCVYVDLLCKHLQMRILVISKFFQSDECRNNTGEISYFCLYESFCEKYRSVFSLEDWAQQWSTLFLSVLIIVATLILKLPRTDLLVLVFSGMCGIIFTLLIDRAYKRKGDSIGKPKEKDKKLTLKQLIAKLFSNSLEKPEEEEVDLKESVQGETGNVDYTK